MNCSVRGAGSFAGEISRWPAKLCPANVSLHCGIGQVYSFDYAGPAAASHRHCLVDAVL